jgi:hypothetical protein
LTHSSLRKYTQLPVFVSNNISLAQCSLEMMVMIRKPQKTFKAIALLLVLTLFQVFVVGVSATPPQEGAKGKLKTTRDQTVTVNGNPTSSGQTVLTGATIETPDGIGATVNLGSLGSIDLAPNSKIEITFSDGQIKVVLVQGCVIVTAKQGTYAEIDTPQGKATSNDPNQKQAMALDVCNPLGASSPIINQGAAANAGAGGGVVGDAEGLSKGWIIFGVIAAATATTLAIVVPCRRGRNPSPGEPRGVNDECR